MYSSALKHTLHGYKYQLELILLAAIDAIENNKQFTLTSEDKKDGKFDDLVIDTEESIVFMQVKHSSKTGASFSKQDFCDKSNEDCSLAKYFSSWMTLKARYSTKKCCFIFFTNRSIKDQDSFLETTESKFLAEATISNLKFKKEYRVDFIEAIKFYTSVDFKNDFCHEDVQEKDLIDAREYLKKRLESTKKEILIDKRNSILTYSIRALIKICCEDESFEDKLVADDTLFSSRFKAHKKLIKIACQHPKNCLASNTDLDQRINQFLDELLIKIGHSTNNQIIIEKLNFKCSIASNELYRAWYCYIDNWLSNPKVSQLNLKEIQEFIYNTNGDLHRFYLLGETTLFKEQCEKKQCLMYEADFTDDLNSFLRNTGEPFISLIINEGGGIKQHVLNSVMQQNGLLDAEWFYISYSSSALSINMPQVLSGDSTKIGIINYCEESFDKIDHRFISEMNKAANSNKKKLLLLIESNQKEDFKSLFKNNTNFKEISLRGLSDDNIKSRIGQSHKEKCLNIAGKHFLLTDLAESTESGLNHQMKNHDRFQELLLHAVQPSEVLNTDIYISNDLVKATLEYSLYSLLVNVKAKQFHIQCQHSNKLIKRIQTMFPNDKKKFYSFEYLDSNCNFCNLKRFDNEILIEEKNIFISDETITQEDADDSILLNVEVEEEEATVYATVLEKSVNLYLPTHENYTFNLEKKLLREDLKNTNNFSILSADAGLGKTSYSLNEVNNWIKDMNPVQLWVVCIRLPDLQFTSDNPELVDAFHHQSTGFKWDKWHLDALLIDMQFANKVRLLLDGLDEIKDVNKLKRFNNWLLKVPKTTSITITTRPYAASKIFLPNERYLDFFIRLTDFNDIQLDEYINAFVSAIYTEKRIELDQIRKKEISNKVCDLLKGASLSKLLGVPLECYLFCEHLKPRIIEYIESQTLPIEFEEPKDVTAVRLIQKFINVKLIYFLQKHMKMSHSETLIKPHRVFSFTSSYTDVLITFAFRQAFSLDFSFINEQLIGKYFSKEMLEEMKDIGILDVELMENETYIKFKHETYQEYFSALYIFKEILYLKTNKAEEMLTKHRFDPQYHIIIMLAAQLFLEGDPLFPIYKNEKVLNEGISRFISIIFNKDDILGSANSALLNKCFAKAPSSILNMLSNSFKIFKELLVLNNDQTLRKDKEQIPITNNNKEENVFNGSPVTDIIQLKMDLKNKEKVLETMKNLSSDSYPQVVLVFLEIIEDNDLNHYWDIDGGFEAIVLLKNAFNEELASYFIKRLEFDPSWRAQRILDAINKVDLKDLEISASKAFMRVFFSLRNHQEHLKSSLAVILLNYEDIFINELKDQLIESMQMATVHTLENILLNKFINDLLNLLWFADTLKYAVIFKGSQLRFQKSREIVINLTDFIDKGVFFSEYLTQIISILDDTRENFLEIIKNHSLEELEKLITFNNWKSYKYFIRLRNENTLKALTENVSLFSSQFEKLDNKSIKSILGQLFEFNLVKEYIVDVFASLLSKKGSDDHLFESLQYVGYYFNQKFSYYILEHGRLEYKFFGEILKRDIRAIDSIYELISKVVKNYWIFSDLLKDLSTLKVLDQKLADIFISEFETDKAKDKQNKWSLKYGIEAVEFIGKFFNQKCVEYLILRGGF